MNKQKAMMDALMGTARNVAEKDKTGDEFKGDDICKHFLVGFCPDHSFGKLLQKERNPLDNRPLMPAPCTMTHSAVMKADFEKHAKAESFRREYEDSLLKRLQEIVADMDRMILIGKPKCAPQEKYMRFIGDPRIAAQRTILKEEKDRLTSEVVRRGEAGDVVGAQDAADKIKECITQIDLIELKHTVDFPGEECCPVCSFRYLKGEKTPSKDLSGYVWQEDHVSNKSHKAYLEIRDRFEKLRAKKKERQSEPKKAKSRSRSRSKHSRDRDQGRGDSDRRGGDRRDDNRRRDRSSDKGRDNDRGYDRGGRRDSDSRRDSDRDRRNDRSDRGDRGRSRGRDRDRR